MQSKFSIDELKQLEDRSNRRISNGERTFFDPNNW